MVFSVRTFNNINQIGLKELGNKFQIDGDHAANPDAFIIRSENLHGFDFPENLKAIARAGAGTNNIPIEEATEKGIVVFNTPGANANAVKRQSLLPSSCQHVTISERLHGQIHCQEMMYLSRLKQVKAVCWDRNFR